MFAQSMNPSREGLWTRVAPVAATLAVVTSFVLSLVVLVSTVDNLQTALGHARFEKQHRPAVQRVLVQKRAVTAPTDG